MLTLLQETSRQKKAVKLRLAVLAFVVLFFNSVIGEEQVRRLAVDDTQKTQYEKNLEERLTRDIESYLGHKFFIVRTDALLEKLERYRVDEIITEIPIPVPPKPAVPPPVPAKAPDPQRAALEQMQLETEDGIQGNVIGERLGLDEPLPGLPLSASVFDQTTSRKGLINRELQPPKQEALPPAAPPPAPEPAPQVKVEKKKVETLVESRIETKKLLLKVLLDEHITQEQETFIKQIVIDGAGVNFIRGDELRIMRSAFPGASVLDPPPEEPADEPEAVIPEPAAQEPPPELTTQEKVLKWLQENWPLATIIALLALVLLVLLLRRKPKQNNNNGAPQPIIIKEENKRESKLDELLKKMGAKEDILNDNRIQAIREDVVSMAVTDYSLLSEQIKEWLATGNEEDLNKLATVQNLMGGQFNSLFKSLIDPESMIVLTARGQQQDEELSPEDRLALVESVYQSLMQKQYKERHGVQHQIRPFSFLERLNDDQVMYLIRSEDIKVKALVLSQLSAERAANILKRGSAVDRTRLATEVSLFRELPVEAFRDVANRLARRAINVPSFAHIEMDGVDLLTDMLDHMATADEAALLTALRQDNPDLFYQIKKVYISFNDLARLPKLALRNLVREISREQLALALFDMPEEFRNSIFAAMLDRPRAMLISTIRGLQSPDETTVEQAKRTVARKARELLKGGAISLSEAAEERTGGGAAA